MTMPVSAVDADFDPKAAMEQYMRDGAKRAVALRNRGPIRFVGDGALHPEIVAAYLRCGFYVFEDVLKKDELADIEADLFDILDRLPVQKGAAVDAKGRPALAVDCAAPALFWSKPLADPFGSTQLANGRHPVKMHEPKPAVSAPKEIVYIITGSLQFSDAALRVYGHPDLLAIAAAFNGRDFVPFNEALFIKEPGLGASVAWHQDGVTHWDSAQWDQGIHGFNFMAQLYGCTPANAVWVIPGSHAVGKVDIGRLAAEAGSDRLPDAVPLICNPGDVVINNRQLVHGSFANTSKDWRVTVNFGFHRRNAVLGVEAGGGNLNARAVYDADRIRHRARLIGYAIDARRKRFPHEIPYTYLPHQQDNEMWKWDEAARKDIKDYNLEDLST